MISSKTLYPQTWCCGCSPAISWNSQSLLARTTNSSSHWLILFRACGPSFCLIPELNPTLSVLLNAVGRLHWWQAALHGDPPRNEQLSCFTKKTKDAILCRMSHSPAKRGCLCFLCTALFLSFYHIYHSPIVSLNCKLVWNDSELTKQTGSFRND